MPRQLSRAQQLENAAFLRLLRTTGNVRATCEALGRHRALFTRRRAKHPAFAADWDAALAIAHATLNKNPPRTRSARQVGSSPGRSSNMRGMPDLARGTATQGVVVEGSNAKRTAGDPHLHRTPSGRVQLRRSAARRLTHAAEQAFLAALSATANVRLSAAAAGFSHSTFYARAKSSPAFAREMRLALQMGFDRIELALIESTLVESHQDDAWRHNDPPPIPPMTANQALQLLYLHQKQARLLAEPAHIKRRRGESADAHSFRLAAMYRAQVQRDRDAFDIAEAVRRAAGKPRLFGPEHLPERPMLPDLAQVTGWSKAKVDRESHDATRALFGGWRLKDWEG